MSESPTVLAVGVVDAERIRGSGGLDRTWQELGVAAPGDGRTPRRLFDRTDSTYRRLDRISRSLVLAAMAAGIEDVLGESARHAAAVLAETHVGCLEIDRRYTRSLADDVVEATIFPYTLPTTSLGEMALRFGLRGLTSSLSVDDARRGAALREAQRMFAAGEIEHAVVASVDVLDESAPGLPAGLRAVVAVLARSGGRAVGPWPLIGASRDPFGAF